MARKINPIAFRLGVSLVWKYSNIISLTNYTNSFINNFILTLYLPKIIKNFYLIVMKISVYKKRLYGKLYIYILYIHFKNTRYKIKMANFFLKFWLKKNLPLLLFLHNFYFFHFKDFLNFYFSFYLTKIWIPYCKFFFIEPYEQKLQLQNFFYLWYQFNGVFFILPYGRFTTKDFYKYNLSKLFDFMFDFPNIDICNQIVKYLGFILEKDRRHWPLINQVKAIFKRGFINFIKLNIKICNMMLRISGKIKGARRSRKLLLFSNNSTKICFQQLYLNLYGSYFFANTKYGTIGLHFYIHLKKYKLNIKKFSQQTHIWKEQIKFLYLNKIKKLKLNKSFIVIKYNSKFLNIHNLKIKQLNYTQNILTYNQKFLNSLLKKKEFLTFSQLQFWPKKTYINLNKIKNKKLISSLIYNNYNK